MELNANDVFEVLTRKGVTALYHANSVRTSFSFLSAGRLLSRGAVEQYGLAQTAQKSDDIDKIYGIWNDIFLDAVDIHATAKTCNWYGPVLFVLDLGLLKSIPTICVTQCDPLKWKDDDKPCDRFIQSVDELEATYVPGDLDKMFVIRCLGGALPLQGTLRSIVLDHLELADGDQLYQGACDALLDAAKRSGVSDVNIFCRVCGSGCRCQEATLHDAEKMHMMFKP